MDYKDIKNKDSFIKFRDEQLNKLKQLLTNWTESKYKKSVLLSYWFNDYIRLLKHEDKFKNQGQYQKYKRGQILFVNFGYRIGHELGGNHYCVVISKKDSIYSGNITVIPLRSFKGKINHKFQVDLKAKELSKKSIADINQITTISKSRIINPIRSNDTLSGVRLDSHYLDKINLKVKELFIFDK